MLLDIFTFESMITCQVSNKVTEQRSSNYGVQKTKRKTASCKIYFFLIIKRNVMYLCTIKLHHANQSCHSKCPYPFISVLQGIEWQIDRDAMTAKQIMNIYRVAAFQHHLSPRLHMCLAAAPLHILSDSQGHSLMFISGHRKG